MQQSLIQLLHGIYQEIYRIEKDLGILGDGQDYRPRIEYFHDAVRELSACITGTSRLSVEFLAYDIAMLRYIQTNPLGSKKNNAKNLSSSTAVKPLTTLELSSAIASGNNKSVLSELYKKYAVIFSALFAAKAENDYKERVDHGNTIVENIALLQNIIKKSANVSIATLVDEHIEDMEVAHIILALFAQKQKKIAANAANDILATKIKDVDKQKRTIEQAHFSYATHQLAIYENAKDVVKKMAINGLNIVGSFVEDAIRTTGGADRGR